MFFLTILAAAFVRVYLIIRDSVPFAYDMGRDLLWVKDISFYKIPTLIGPAASIWGVYFGPLWFYFLAIPVFIFGGNPLSAVYATAATVVTTGVLAFFLFNKYLGKSHSFTLAVIILFSATSINISTFAFHANLLPLLTLLMIYFCFLAAVRPIFLAFAFLSTSLMFHADPAPAIVFSLIPAFFFFNFKIYKSKDVLKVLVLSVILYVLPFSPQILFEIRNNFIQTKSLIAYFTGENPSLSGQLPIIERLFNRIFLYFDLFKKSFAPQNNTLAFLMLIFGFIGLNRFLMTKRDGKIMVLFKVNLYSLIITFIVFTFLMSVEIKNWYLSGVFVIYTFLLTIALLGFKNFKFPALVFVTIFLFLNLSPFFKIERITESQQDPARLTNQLLALDTIYDDAKGLFAVYVYTPVIYDLNYQYLFWWQTQKGVRILPEDFAYLPNQPDYLRNKEIYAKPGKITDTVYLVIEQGQENEFYTSGEWLKNFEGYQVLWEKDINEAIKLQKRIK